MAHRRAKLTVFGRQLLVDRIVVDRMPVAHAAAMAGVSRTTAWKWVRRYREARIAGLEDQARARIVRPARSGRSESRPSSPPATSSATARTASPPSWGIPRSTIGTVLARHGVSRLADRDRPTGIPIRYVRERPGELVHVDVKKLGRIPDGGGHRFRGRGHGTPRARAGFDRVHQAVDDASRVAYVEVHPDERGVTCAGFLRGMGAFFAGRGVRIERVMTDNAKNYVASRAFQAALAELGARHKRTRAYRPQTNGKSERFNRTLLDEWAYVREYATNAERLEALPGFVERYNHDRPHTALNGLPPMGFLVNNVSGNHI